MAAAVGDLIQLVDNQLYLAQQCINVYYYRMTSVVDLGDNYLEDLNTIWEDLVLDEVIGLQSDALTHVSREWKNLSNNLDFFTDNTVVPGFLATPGGENTPSYVSAGFLLQRETLATRNGYKRFAGIPEGSISGNTYVGSTAVVDAVEAALASDLMAGIVSVAEPVIVKRPIVPPVGVYVYSSIGSAAFRGLGTQNTRKLNRGV